MPTRSTASRRRTASRTRRVLTRKSSVLSEKLQRALYAFVAVITVASQGLAAMPVLALSSNSSNLANMDGFEIDSPYTTPAGQPTAAGDFNDSTIPAVADGNRYPEGACVPVLLQVTNEDNNVNHSLTISPWFEYREDGTGEVGVERYELITTQSVNDDPRNANNLNDFVFTGTALSNTSFKRTSGGTGFGTTQAIVSGPYSGNGSAGSGFNTTATTASDHYRHYNVTLQDVPAGRTVFVLMCARLGANAQSFGNNGDTEILLGVAGVDVSGNTVSDDEVRIQATQLQDVPQTGKLVVTKVVVNDNGGTKTVSNFPLFANASSVTSGIAKTLTAGTYTITETADAGYAASFSNGCNEQGQVNVIAGATSTCTITNNDKPGTLIVTKTVINNDGGTKVSSDFTIDVSGSRVSPSRFSGSATGTTVTLDAGSYNVTEQEVEGYEATFSSGCSGTIANGQTKTCTITNRDESARLIVIKHVINDNGGWFDADDFEIHVDGTDVSDRRFDGRESGRTVTLDAGEYRVWEEESSGYTATYSNDCSGTIANGETKTCRITNNDRPATLTVKKLVVNDSETGTKLPEDFTLRVYGTNVSTSTFQGNAEGTVVTLDVGFWHPFFVIEDSEDMPGYTGRMSGDCRGLLWPGQSTTCTITNNDDPSVVPPTGVLNVIKRVVNDNGGTLTPDAFTLVITDANQETTQVAGSEAGVRTALPVGAYSVVEATSTVTAGYETTYSEGCSGTIEEGTQKECIVTNTAKLASLTVVKRWTNDNGGTFTMGAEELFVNGQPVESGVATSVRAGTISVSETPMAGWTTSYSGACDSEGSVTLAIGQEETCYVNNDDIAPTVTIIKNVVNDDNGQLSAEDFTLIATQDDAKPVRVQGSEEGTTITLNAGTFDIGESVYVRDGETGDDTETPHGYTMTRSSGTIEEDDEENQQQEVEEYCTGTLALGEHVTCTITNDDPEPTSGTLIVKKHVINDGTGNFGAMEFLLTLTTTVTVRGEEGSETETHTQMFRGSEAGEVFNALAPGTTYTVTESPFQAWVNAFGVLGPMETGHGYTASLSEGCSGTIVAGETIICTVTNDDPGSTPPENGGGGGGGGGGAATDPRSAGPSSGGGSTPGRVLGIEDVPETTTTIEVCRAEDPDAKLVTLETEAMLQQLGLSRIPQDEQKFDGSLVPRVIPDGTELNDRARVRDFTTYGPKALKRLGAGERAGVIASYVLIYKRLPKTECDWQNAVRIAKGFVPVVLSPEREKAVEADFAKIYGRAPDRLQEKDNATILIMAYGLRPVDRSLSMERQAIRIFRAIFLHVPRITHEWDVMRGVAYGGLVVPGFAAIVR